MVHGAGIIGGVGEWADWRISRCLLMVVATFLLQKYSVWWELVQQATVKNNTSRGNVIIIPHLGYVWYEHCLTDATSWPSSQKRLTSVTLRTHISAKYKRKSTEKRSSFSFSFALLSPFTIFVYKLILLLNLFFVCRRRASTRDDTKQVPIIPQSAHVGAST